MNEHGHKDNLVGKGLKNTRHRTMIFHVLEEVNKPMTAEEIFLALKEKSASTCLSTVYRTLEIFEEKEMIIKSKSVDDGKARYELNTNEHKHQVICVNCHRITTIDEECPFKEIEEVLKNKMEFNVTGHKLEIYGRCKDCSKRQ